MAFQRSFHAVFIFLALGLGTAVAQEKYQRGPFIAAEAQPAPEWNIEEWVVGPAQTMKGLQEPIGVEGLVGQQRCEGDIVDQGSNPLHVVRLPRQKQKAEQVAERIDQGNDFGRQPAARASDGLMPCPPFAPEAF